MFRINEKYRNNGYNALIYENYDDINIRLVIQVLYGLGQEIKNGEIELKINIKISGTELGQNEGKVGKVEKIAPIPYVIDFIIYKRKKNRSNRLCIKSFILF